MTTQQRTSGRAVGYVRVSSDKQAIGGVSLEAQSGRIRAMATVQDVELVDVLVDAGESAKSLNRPGMARLLEMVDRRDVQTVIVAKLDRLTRSVRDLTEQTANGRPDGGEQKTTFLLKTATGANSRNSARLEEPPHSPPGGDRRAKVSG